MTLAGCLILHLCIARLPADIPGTSVARLDATHLNLPLGMYPLIARGPNQPRQKSREVTCRNSVSALASWGVFGVALYTQHNIADRAPPLAQMH